MIGRRRSRSLTAREIVSERGEFDSTSFAHNVPIANSCSLAYAEMRMILAKLILNFDMELAYPNEPWWEKQGTYIVWEKLPLMVNFRPRQ